MSASGDNETRIAFGQWIALGIAVTHEVANCLT
jgi:hypothetical protein